MKYNVFETVFSRIDFGHLSHARCMFSGWEKPLKTHFECVQGFSRQVVKNTKNPYEIQRF